MPTYRTRNGRVQVQVRIKEGKVIVHQESATFDTLAQAKHWGTELEKTLKRNGIDARKRSQVTLAHLFDLHEAGLDSVGRASSPTKSRFKAIRPYRIASKPVDSITSADWVDWAIEHSDGRSPATLLNHLMAVSAAYRAAPVAYGVATDMAVITNAITHLKRLRVVASSVQRSRRVSDEEVGMMCGYWNKLVGTSLPMSTLIRFMIALPRRRSEVMSALWADYDADNGTLMLRNTKHPTLVRDELIPVPVAAQAILKTLPRKGPRIFPHKAASVSSAFNRCVKMVGLENLHLHDLRHEGISRLFETGLDIPSVSLISGHTSWATLKRYTHIQPKHVLEKLHASSQRAQKALAESQRP